VQTIGELDQDDAQITHHREQHFAERFRLRFFSTFELDLIEFCDAIDDLGDGFTKATRQLFFGDRRIFDDIMQDRGDDRVGVDLETREDDARCNGVGDVGLARFSFLPFVGFGAEFGGDPDAFDLFRRQVTLSSRQQFLQAGRGSAR